MGISQAEFAKHLGWSYARLNEIINAKRGVSADSALAFAEAFDISPEFWLNLQRNWDLWHAKRTHVNVRLLKKAS
jgi:addiction module HigA family antidote